MKSTTRARIGVVVSRFNRAVTDALLKGTKEAAAEVGVALGEPDIYPVSGAFELPLVAQALAKSGKYDGIVCLGAVIRGETPHFDYVCQQTAAGIQRVALDCGLPVAFGVLTTDTLEQALARAGGDFGNKGRDAFVTVMETLHQLRRATEA